MIIRPTFTVTLLEFNKPTITGRVYRTTSFRVLPDNVFGVNGVHDVHHDKIDLNKVSFRAENIRIVNDKLLAEIDILNTPDGQVLRQMMAANKYAFRTASLALISATLAVSDAELIGAFVELEQP